jgi:hypothetical protein
MAFNLTGLAHPIPAQFLDNVVRNTQVEEPCPDDEVIKVWVARPSAPSLPRVHYRRTWAANLT